MKTKNNMEQSTPKSERHYRQYSAGILPFARVKGDVFVLLGEDKSECTWSDFGGRVEPSDMEDPKTTASREFYEESCGSVVNLDVMRNRLEHEKHYKMFETTTLNGSPYYTYLVQIPSKNYSTTFNKTWAFLTHIKANKKFIEKTSIKWVPLNDIVAAIESPDETTIHLRSVFRASLKKFIVEIKNL